MAADTDRIADGAAGAEHQIKTPLALPHHDGAGWVIVADGHQFGTRRRRLRRERQERKGRKRGREPKDFTHTLVPTSTVVPVTILGGNS